MIQYLFSTKQNRISNSSSNPYQRRSISAGISRSLDAASIKSRIDTCEIVNLFRAESLEAGYILNILYNLDKLTEMKGQQSSAESQDIEEVFMNSFWKEVNKFHIEETDEDAVLVEKSESIAPTSLSLDLSHNDESEGRSLLSTDLMGEMDALLSMAFEQCATYETNNLDTVVENEEEANNCYKVFEKYAIFFQIFPNSIPFLQRIFQYKQVTYFPFDSFFRISQITDFPLPLSTVIHDCLKKILKSRISIANKYVLRIFMDEYKVLDHLINLQRVFFFGAGDLMLTFYSKLFKSVIIFIEFFFVDFFERNFFGLF